MAVDGPQNDDRNRQEVSEMSAVWQEELGNAADEGGLAERALHTLQDATYLPPQS